MPYPLVTWKGQKVPLPFVVIMDIGPLFRRKKQINSLKTGERLARDRMFLEQFARALDDFDLATSRVRAAEGSQRTHIAVYKSSDGELMLPDLQYRCPAEGDPGLDPFWPRYRFSPRGCWEYFIALERQRRTARTVDEFLRAFLALWRQSVGLPRAKDLTPDAVLQFLAASHDAVTP